VKKLLYISTVQNHNKWLIKNICVLINIQWIVQVLFNHIYPGPPIRYLFRLSDSYERRCVNLRSWLFKKILTSFYYPNNQHSSVIIFHKYNLHLIPTEFFHLWVFPQDSKIFFVNFSPRCRYCMLKLIVLITNIVFFDRILSHNNKGQSPI
jgi:hypothetical protein